MTAPTPSGRPCPRPDKRKFFEPGQAYRHLDKTFVGIPADARPLPYMCVCGWVHLGRSPAQHARAAAARRRQARRGGE